MNRLKRILLLALLLNIYYSVSYAQVDGSEMSWTCLGGDSFLVKVTVYKDCNGSALGNFSVNFKCQSTGTSITNLSLTLPSPVDITPYCNTSCSRCQSSTCTFPYGMNKYTYQGVVNLSTAGSCCNIIMSMSYGTRSSSITTGAAGAGFYNEAMMNRCQSPCDNSPVFTNNPIQILCSGQEYTLNHGVLDNDYASGGGIADSLTYEWAQPMSAANTPISYSGSYTYQKPIYFYGFPTETLPFPRGLHLDAKTGDIQFRPTKVEQTVMVVKVKAFRSGVKIAEVNRDIRVLVITCPINYSPTITTPNNVRAKSVCVGQTVSFSFTTFDPNATDTVRIGWNNGIPGATWSSNNGATRLPTATLSWTPTASDAGKLPHTFTVSASDNACPMKGSSTQQYQITVNPIPVATIGISDSGCGNYYFRAIPTVGTSPSYVWSSDSFTFSPNTGPVVSHTFLRGRYPVKMAMTALGCSKSFYDTANVDTFMSVYLPADTSVCLNATISVSAFVKNVTSPYTLKWGSGSTVFPGDTTLTSQITVTKDTTIWIRATYGSFSCPYDEITIKTHPVYSISLPDDTFYCNLNNNMLPPKFYPKRTAFKSFKWYHNTSPAVVDSGAFLNVTDTGFYKCIVIDTFNCTASDSVKIHQNPAVIASAIDTSVCLGTYAHIMADSIPGHTYTYEWLQNSVVLSTNKMLSVKPLTKTDYYLVAYEKLNGITCSGIHISSVSIKALPVIKFSAFPKACEFSTPLQLNNYVKVDGISVSNGSWMCKNNSALVSSDSFLLQNAAFNSVTGYKLGFGFTDTITKCFNSDTTYLKVYAKPAKPTIKVTGDTTACFGDSLTLASMGNYVKYKWTTNDTTKQIVVKNSGSYSLIVTSAIGCTSYPSKPVNVIVYPKTTKPVISISAADSFLEGDLTDGFYSWYYRRDTIPAYTKINTTSRRINPKTYCNQGYFKVIHTDSNGCKSDTSAAYYFMNLSIDKGKWGSGLIFYPNPAHHLLVVENPLNEKAELQILDIYGRVSSQKKLLPGKSTLDISNLKPGIYILRLNSSIVSRLVVE